MTKLLALTTILAALKRLRLKQEAEIRMDDRLPRQDGGLYRGHLVAELEAISWAEAQALKEREE